MPAGAIKASAKSAIKGTVAFLGYFKAVKRRHKAGDQDCKKQASTNETAEPICRPQNCGGKLPPSPLAETFVNLS
jgi:hypothetical protein